MERSPPGTSVHGIPQARPLDWIAIFFSKDHPNQQVTCRSPALQVDSLSSESPGKQIWVQKNVRFYKQKENGKHFKNVQYLWRLSTKQLFKQNNK